MDYALLSEGPEGSQILPFVGTPQLDNLDFVRSLGTPRVKGVEVEGFVPWGKDENFFEWASADILFASLTVQWRPTGQLRVDGRFQLQSYERRTDDSIVGIRRIPRLKVEYQVTRAVFLRAIPLLTAAGYVLAEGKASVRLVRFFRALFGWTSCCRRRSPTARHAPTSTS